MWEILKSPNIINLHREITILNLKINVNLPQLLCIVISVNENGEFERFELLHTDWMMLHPISVEQTA